MGKSFKELLEIRYQSIPGGIYNIPNTILSIDPGETTGWSTWNRDELLSSGEEATINKESRRLQLDLTRLYYGEDDTVLWDAIVCEDYLVYAHKVDRHVHSRVETLRVIGAFEILALMDDVPLYYQTAAMAKGFVTDDKLKEWGFYSRGNKHARDSMRHALYFMLVTNYKIALERGGI